VFFQENLNKETLKKQYFIVKKKTDLSNVMKYGNNSIVSEVVGKFQGSDEAPKADHVMVGFICGCF
jgi:macrodomain Ter protein organizer (MatP/YcbG family)